MQANFSLKFAIIFAAGIGLSTAVGAQNTSAASTTANAAAPDSDAAKALATKMVALQNGPEMDRMVYQLTSGAMEALPSSKQDKAREQLNTELKKTGDTTKKIIEGQMAKSANSVLEKAYLERFTEDELKAIVAMFESPIFKKYQSVAPELGNVWVKDVIDNSRGAVLAEGKSFDDIAAKIVDEKSSNASTKTAPAKAAATKK